MTTFAGRFDFESPWIYGPVMFVSWIAGKTIASGVFEGGFAGGLDASTVAVAAIFAVSMVLFQQFLGEDGAVK